MTKLSGSATAVIFVRVCIFIAGLLPIIYFIHEYGLRSVNQIGTEGKEWMQGIAGLSLWLFCVPSLVIIAGLLLRLTAIRWLVLLWDITFLIMWLSYFGIGITGDKVLIVLVALAEVLCLFLSPIVVKAVPEEPT